MRVITQQLQISIYGVLIGLLLYLNKSGAACPDGTFTCTSVTGQRCVPNSWICDGEKDCEDNADEHPSLCSRTVSNCTDTEFLCKTKWCIPMKWKCNGYDDCGDRSDELCDICSTAHFQCADLSACVPGPWRCDGEVDCRDRSDEVGCAQSCGVGYLSCHNNRGSGPICYTPAQRCNGIRDCQTGADEDGCLSTTTTPTARPTCDKSTQFDCLDNGRRCISLAQVCDHFNDCGSNQDEAANVCWGNTCKVNNGGCEGGCVYNSEQGQRCTCGTGYILGNDSKSCLDVDECKEGLRCSQLCENTDGGYNCSCAEGYERPEKSPDTCKASSGDIVLIVAAQRDIREIRLKSKETFQLIENLRGIVAVDFDVTENVLYWTEVSDPKIGSLQLTASHKDIVSIPEVLVNTNIDTPDGIAFDWVHKNLYWTDTGKNTVQVINVKSGLRKVLVREYLDEPRAIVVDPRDDYGPYMYWSDWGQNARIEKAGLDGSNRQKIVTENVHWPNGIAIDFPQNRLYWIDRRLQLIASTDLDGRSHHLLSMVGEDAQTFSMDIFQDSIFYSDWHYGSLFKANKRVPNETVSVRKLSGDPKGLRVFHTLRQPAATDRCEGVNCSSSAMCVPSPSWPGYTCLCADNPPNRNQTCVPGVPVTTQSVDDDVTTDDLTTMTSEAETTIEQTSGSYRCRLEWKVLQLVVLLVWTQMISRVWP